MREAAEQTERLDIPHVRDYSPLAEILKDWPAITRTYFCDERLAGDQTTDSLRILSEIGGDKAAILVGPEGGSPCQKKR